MLCKVLLRSGECLNTDCKYEHKITKRRDIDYIDTIRIIFNSNDRFYLTDELFELLKIFTRECNINNCLDNVNCLHGVHVCHYLLCDNEYMTGVCDNTECYKQHIVDKIINYSKYWNINTTDLIKTLSMLNMKRLNSTVNNYYNIDFKIDM